MLDAERRERLKCSVNCYFHRYFCKDGDGEKELAVFSYHPLVQFLKKFEEFHILTNRFFM